MSDNTNQPTNQTGHTLTLEEAKALTLRDQLYSVQNFNAKGQPQRWRVNGQPKTWKRSPGCVRVPVKHGLYAYDAITERSLHLVTLDEQYARDQRG